MGKFIMAIGQRTKVYSTKLLTLSFVFVLGATNIGFAAPASSQPEIGPNGIIIANNKVPNVGKSKGAKPVPGKPNLLEIMDDKGNGLGLYTHGPDAAPAQKSTEPTIANAPYLGLRNLTTHVGVETPWPCGNDDNPNAIEGLYIRSASQADRIYQLKPNLDRYIRNIETVVNESALSSGGSQRRLLFRTTTSYCYFRLTEVVLSEAAVNNPNNEVQSFYQMINELKALGFNNRKYLIWAESNQPSCGQSTTITDSRKLNNPNNGVPSYARVNLQTAGGTCVDFGELHEIMHSLGAVQPDAPHALAGGHCYDVGDMMCIDPPNPVESCPLVHHYYRLDCNDDDYFDANSGTTGYTSLFFNIANDSNFISKPGPIATKGTSWFTDGGRYDKWVPYGGTVEVAGTGAAPGKPYVLYTARASRDGVNRCSVDLVPITTTVRYASTTNAGWFGPGYIGNTSGPIGRSPGTYDVCFYSVEAGTMTSHLSLTVY
jgi:hypothetical protein